MNGMVESITKDTLKSHNKKFIFFKSVGMKKHLLTSSIAHTAHLTDSNIIIMVWLETIALRKHF